MEKNMKYEQFCEELKKVVLTDKKMNILEEHYFLCKRGDSFEDDAKKELLRLANMQYCDIDTNEEALEDYLFFYVQVTDECMCVCQFSVKFLYKAYMDLGWNCVLKIFYKYIDHLKTVTFTSELDNYEKIKERFSLAAINYEANKGLLKNYIHKRLGDVAYVVETAIFKNGEETAFGRIPANLMEIWGVSTDEVFEAAISNLYLNNPPRLFKTPEEILQAGNIISRN